MGRPKGSKNKVTKVKAERTAAKAKAKARAPAKTASPDWLRKAMAPTKTPQKRGPKPKALKEKFQTQAKAKRGKNSMAKDKSFYDPMDDPDLRAPDVSNPQLDQSLPPKPSKATPLVLEPEPEPAPVYDEVAAGEAIPYANAEALIAGTMGGGGDQHADAKRILGRMAEVNWLITKGSEDTPAGKAIKARKKTDDGGYKATKEGDDATF